MYSMGRPAGFPEGVPRRYKKLRAKEKTFITIGLLFTIIICGGLYLNHKLDSLVTKISKPGLLFISLEDDFFLPDETLAPLDPDGGLLEGDWTDNDSGATPPPAAAPGAENEHSGQAGPGLNAVQAKLSRPLEKKDLLRAGLIILRKLDKEEISFLFRIGSQDSYSRQELQDVRGILLAKLSPKDILTLKEIGAKYGKQLRLLDPGLRLP